VGPISARRLGRHLYRVALGAALAAAGLPAVAAQAQVPSPADAQAFLERLWPAAHARGIARATFERATAGLAPDPEVLALTARQPEHNRTAGAYVTGLTAEERVEAGRQRAVLYSDLLADIEATYRVDRHILTAIWGVETAYGADLGSRQVIRSLATLAMADPRRADFWRRELIAALRMLQDGDAAADTFVGSWAGAVGHTQFIPSTYATHAVDFDRDGRRDLRGSVADALASTANFLRAVGWAAGLPWGVEVKLPGGFDFAWSAPGRVRTWPEWEAVGVAVAGKRGDLTWHEPLQLILPAGAGGPAFLVTRNFAALRRYNQSTAYALTVGHLADRIAGAPPLAARWPADDLALSRAERQELQGLLTALGFDTGGHDGVIGDRTNAAIRATQRRLRMSEDGYPSAELLLRLRSSGAP
jgi:lytic murein transglycosylase